MDETERLTLQQTADILGVHYMTAYRYVRTGRLVAHREGSQWVVNRSDLERFRTGAARPEHRESARSERPARLVERMVAGDEAGAWAIIEAALAGGLDPTAAYLDLLVPALRIIGDRWETGTLSVAAEHRASTVALRLVGRLGPLFARRGRKRGTIVIGAVQGEQHSLPSAIVTDLLRGAGFDVLDTGANTPPESFVDSARAADRLVAVLVGATTPDRAASVRSAVIALREADISPVLVGGAAIRDGHHATSLGADGWTGPDGRALLEAVDRQTSSARA